MRRPLAPIWLAQPSRLATVSQTTARWFAAGVVVLLLACLFALDTAVSSIGDQPVAGPGSEQTDVALYESIVSGVRHGGNYYAVTADALRAGNYPLRPFVTFRLPTLAMVQAVLPPYATPLLLWALAATVMLLWYRRLRPAFVRPAPRLMALALLAGGMIAFVQADLAPFHEVWTGLLIALSLAVRRRGRWVEAAAIGLMAALIHEAAAMYVGVMAVLAWVEAQRREALGWSVVALVLAVVVAIHAHAVAQVVRPLDPASPGWAGLLGFGFFVRTMVFSTALGLAPLWLAAPLVGLALIGWAGWRDSLALRAFVTFCAYALLISLFGRTDTFYWGLLVAPTILVGLAAAPDVVRDTIAAARDSRRIKVTRMTR